MTRGCLGAVGRVRVDWPRFLVVGPLGSRPIGSGERPRGRHTAGIEGSRLRTSCVLEPLYANFSPRWESAAHDADAVIVDCLTVWVANLMLRGDSDEAILKDAEALAELAAAPRAELRLVSNETGLGVHPPTVDGLRFRDLLGLVNQRVAAVAPRVVLMVAGLPHMLKDTPPGSPFGAPSHEAP